MILSVHFITSLILSAAFYPFYGISSLLVFIGGFFIDIDHFLWNLAKFRDFNILKAYNFHMENVVSNDFSRTKGILLLFHNLEFVLLMLLLSFVSEIFLLITYGLVLHLLLDLINLVIMRQGMLVQPSVVSWLVNLTK
jgi:hypothetical protein